MKIVCISDTHEQHEDLEIPNGDILIHAGDLTWRGEPKAVEKFIDWFYARPHKHKVFIAGNHDFFFENLHRDQGKFVQHYLNNSGAKIGGLKFWGSPMTPTFGAWAFMEDRDKIKKYWDMIPDDTEILITHGPPFGILDKTPRHQSVGCEELLKRVQKVKPKLHIFGHIHHGYGMKEIDGTIFINAAICDESYDPINAPIVVEV